MLIFEFLFFLNSKKKGLNFEKGPSFFLQLKKKVAQKPPTPPNVVLHFFFGRLMCFMLIYFLSLDNKAYHLTTVLH
jgi:hypothetical protein